MIDQMWKRSSDISDIQRFTTNWFAPAGGSESQLVPRFLLILVRAAHSDRFWSFGIRYAIHAASRGGWHLSGSNHPLLPFQRTSNHQEIWQSTNILVYFNDTTLILSEKIWYQQNINNNPTFSRVFNPTFSQLMPEVPREILSSRKVEPPWMLGPWLNSIKTQRIYQYYWSYYWFLLICFQRFLYIYITLFLFGLPSTPWMIWMANLMLEGQWSLILAKPRVQSSESSERNPWWFPRSLKADVAVCLFSGHEAVGGTPGAGQPGPVGPVGYGMDHDGSWWIQWEGSEVPDVSAFPFRMVFKNVRRLPSQREGPPFAGLQRSVDVDRW